MTFVRVRLVERAAAKTKPPAPIPLDLRQQTVDTAWNSQSVRLRGLGIPLVSSEAFWLQSETGPNKRGWEPADSPSAWRCLEGVALVKSHMKYEPPALPLIVLMSAVLLVAAPIFAQGSTPTTSEISKFAGGTSKESQACIACHQNGTAPLAVQQWGR
jgi:hypothetical protein